MMLVKLKVNVKREIIRGKNEDKTERSGHEIRNTWAINGINKE